MKKRFLLSAILIILGMLVFGAISVSAATSGTCGNNLTWTLDDAGTLTISGTGAMPSWRYSSSVPWDSNRSNVEKVVIENGVTTIGRYAFSDCTSLTSITIPDSVTSIGEDAFFNCNRLTSVTIGNSVTSIGDSAFSDCTGLANITIPDSVTSISGSAFRNCTGLANITIPDSVTSIGDYAFYCCTGLSSVTISDSVTSIGQSTFSNCTGLTSITIPDSVTSIEYGAFSDCTNLTSVIVGDSVISIGDSAFYCCTGLTSVTIPDSVTSIGEYAFYCCTGLTSVTIPDSVTFIGESAFWNCHSLTSVHITDLMAWCNINFGGIDANPLSYGHKLYLNGTLITELTIPDSVTSVGQYAFYKCTGLTSVTIPTGVTSIGDSAFYYCSNLKYVGLTTEVKYIRNDAFNGCSNMNIFYEGSEDDWNNILFYNRNESLTTAKIIYNATKKNYRLETNCDTHLDDITNYAIFTMPTVTNDGMTLTGWYDNAELSGEPVTFPYYGDATTLYASWTDRTGKSFEDAFIAKANQEYTVSTTESGQHVYFEFVPRLSKTYKFYSLGSKDTYGYLYNSNQYQLTYNDDSGDGNNFYISYNLTAGETYYIAVKLYSGTGSFTVVVEEPVDYKINSITLKDMSGSDISSIPNNTFFATVSLTNVSASADTVIVLAQYTASGAFEGLMYIQTEGVPTGSTIKFSIPVDNTDEEIASLKAFCWESFDSMIPMGNSVSFPLEQ